MKLSIREERDLAFMSQKAQEGVLEILQNPSADLASLNAAFAMAEEILSRVRQYVSEPAISIQSVPDAAMRATLQQMFAEQRRSDSFDSFTLSEIELALQTIKTLLAAKKPSDADLIACLDILRAIAGFRPTLRDSSQLRELAAHVKHP